MLQEMLKKKKTHTLSHTHTALHYRMGPATVAQVWCMHVYVPAHAHTNTHYSGRYWRTSVHLHGRKVREEVIP